MTCSTTTHTATTDAFTGIYEMPEAASILLAARMPHDSYPVSSRKLIRWVRTGLAGADAREAAGGDKLITFQDLVSLRVITALRAAKVSLKHIHAAEAYLRETTGHARPFATEFLWTDNSEVFTSLRNRLVAASLHGQIAMDIIKEYLVPVHGLDFEEGIAASWEPAKSVLLKPDVQFGAPCIKGTRIPTRSLRNSYLGGDSIDRLASAYGVGREEVEAAIAWEEKLAA